MTIFHAVIIDRDRLRTYTTTDLTEMEELEADMREEPGYISHSYGEICGPSYTVVYYRRHL